MLTIEFRDRNRAGRMLAHVCVVLEMGMPWQPEVSERAAEGGR
jgi:hypothetical protein